MSKVLIKLNVNAPMPLMHERAATRFEKLRKVVIEKAGFDFLGICGDIFRSSNFTSSKDGVANRSWHKTGRAFDYNQNDRNLIIVSDPRGGKQYFRTFLKCAKQDGSQGEFKKVKDYRGYYISAYVFDFSEVAEEIGFKRIPAWNGWQTKYNRREFWHYQFDEHLTWTAAMAQIAGKTVSKAKNILGLNDRGNDVKELQTALNKRGLLPSKEIDGIFGAKTKAAVIQFQKKNQLDADGLVGAMTRKALEI